MRNIIEYVKKDGGVDFNERPFSAVDALVLCQLSYLKFDNLVPGILNTRISLPELDAMPEKENLFSDFHHAKDNRALYEALLESTRFGKLQMSHYVNYIRPERDVQFAAITFFLPGIFPFVAFRGTDENMVGWEEDFRLALNKPIGGQKLSTGYLHEVTGCFHGPFYIGGHSKGGNLSLYAAMNCTHHIQNRIAKVFSFDGPGFRPEFLMEYHYDNISDRVINVIPKSSIVGMLFNTTGKRLVVEALSVGVFQHDPYRWTVKKGRFVEKELSEQHITFIGTLNEWIYSLDEEHLNRVVHLFCEALQATKAKTTLEFSQDFIKYFMNLLKAGKDIDPGTKEFLQKMGQQYIEIAKTAVKEEVQKRIPRIE